MGGNKKSTYGYLKRINIMDAKEKAIAACEYCPIATNIGRAFNFGWYTNQPCEVCVYSEVNEDGLFLWANNGFGDTRYPCWGWDNKPYSEGLLHAFHKEIADILAEGVPVEKTSYDNHLGEEFQVISNLLTRVTVNGKAAFKKVGVENPTKKCYTLASNMVAHRNHPMAALGFDGSTVSVYGGESNGFTAYPSNVPVSSHKLTGKLPDDLFDVLTDMLDIVDVPVK
jgi:hypothetical protein